VSTCWAKEIERHTDAARSVAARLLGRAVLSVEPIGGGRNSRVYRVIDAERRAYALKAYFRHPADPRDRQAVEFEALRFLWENGLRDVPQPLATDEHTGHALYVFVEGRRPAPAEIGTGDIDAAVAFLGRLKDLTEQPGAENLPAAAEACFSGDALWHNLQSRLERLTAARQDPPSGSALREFMREELLPAADRIAAWGRRQYPFDRELRDQLRTLSPSDFGFHNAVRRESGDWVFLDFEYFGWDDPGKTIADFLLHPAMDLTPAQKRQFVRGVLTRFSGDAELRRRLTALFPLFGLKWCTILLNEFVPEDLLRREFAASAEHDRQSVLNEQLAKARRMLQQVCSEYERFPYGD
jgi:hypothetical protein